MSLEQRNREFFDKIAGSCDSKPWQKKMDAHLTDQLRSSKDWIGVNWITDGASPGTGRDVRLLDYACGPGNLARALGPYVSQIRGIDLSPAMVNRFNCLAHEAGLSNAQAHAVTGNLLDTTNDTLSGSDFFNFDIAAISLGFHHLEQRLLMLKRITERLKPGGVLLILDFLVSPTTGADELAQWKKESEDTIAIAGFTEQDMRELYDQAGLTRFALMAFPEPVVIQAGGREYRRPVFLTKGWKA